jgi:outer membrane immunogenic protein
MAQHLATDVAILQSVSCTPTGYVHTKTGGPMKKLLLATTALVAFAAVGSASAADLPVKAPPMIAAAPVMSWTGCYVSGGVGYGMWNQDHFGQTDPGHFQLTDTITSGGRGWLGRVGVGCDYQVAPSFVIGAFGDYDFMNLHSHGRADVAGLGAEEKESGAWAVGGRIGYLPYPNLMTYVSGGYTQTRFDRQDLFITGINPPIAAGLFIGQHTYNGWFLGGGTEYAVPWAGFRGLFWKTEYRFSSYRADDLPILITATGGPSGIGEHSEKFVQTVTTSLVWKFNWGGPVVARY